MRSRLQSNIKLDRWNTGSITSSKNSISVMKKIDSIPLLPGPRGCGQGHRQRYNDHVPTLSDTKNFT